MTEFPSSIDREVASSLLLLSSGRSSFSSSSRSGSERKKMISKCEGSLSLSFVSCESTLSNTGSSRKCYEYDDFMNFKIAKKRRSNVTWSSVDSKQTHSENHEFVDNLSKCSNNSKEESCLSTGTTSEITSRITEAMSREKTNKKRESHKSSSIRRRAIKILEFLSTSSSSELKIRQLLGDTADTSKALRMLLKMGNVKRSGAGGKHDPFIYKIA